MSSSVKKEEEDEPSFIDADEQWEEGEGDDQDASAQSFPLHRAAYYNDSARIKQLAATMGKEQLESLDPHGNNALHVAALRRATAAAEALVAAGLPVDAKSGRGWTALEEALAARDHATARALHTALLAAARLELKAKRHELLAAMRDMPDYTMKLSWRLGSAMPGLGMLLRRYAPADTYTLWKVKDRLRVDGSLMGLDTKSATLIPEWKRGHFSLIMDGSMCASGTQGGGGCTSGGGGIGSATGDASGSTSINGINPVGNGSSKPATASTTDAAQADPRTARPSDGGGASAPRLLFLHHGKQRWVDLSADKKAMKTEERAMAEDELLAALERDVDKQRFKARGFKFAPLRGWLGGDVHERVEGWDCAVYEAAGKLVGVSTSKAAWDLDDASTFEDYLALTPHEDDVAEVVFDPLNPSTYDPLGARRREEDEAGSDATSSGTPNSAAATDSGGGWFTSSSNKHGKSGSSNGSSSKRGGGGWWWNRSSPQDDASQVPSESSDALTPDVGSEALADHPPSMEAWDVDNASVTGDEASPKQLQLQQCGPQGSGSGAGLSRLGPGGTGGRPVRGPQPSAAAVAAAKRRQKKKAERGSGGRTLRARLWMASGFPMRLSQLIPLLDVIGAANKQISKVGRFMARYADMDLFPVRIQVPLLLTVYAVVGFSAFRELGPEEAPGPEFFQVPEDYTRRLLNEMIDKHTGGIMSHGPGGRRRPYGSSDDDEGMFGGDVDWF